MTLVTGTVEDIGFDPVDGTLWARPARFRSDGGVVRAPERTPYPITGGVVSVTLAPGPAVLELRVGSHARGTFEVVIPDQESITLADLLDTVFPWEPEQVSLFVAERLAAEGAKDDAVTAAGAAVGAATTAATAAAQTGQDRTAVADDKAVVVGHVQALAAPNDAAVLGLISEGATTQTKAALNATYADKDVEVEVSSGRLSKPSLDGAYASYHYPLEIPTYDGNPSITHPDVLYIEGGWNGYSYWMAFTPFPDDPRENPSVVASNDGVHWEVPVGGTNPVAPYSELEPGFTYFSDTDIIRLANGNLALYYRATNPSANQARIYLKTSSNGITWSAATTVIQVSPSAHLASPAVVREADGTFSMWSINAATGNHLTRWERRTSADGITWSAPTTCTVPAIRGGGEPWHLDVIRDATDGGYHALLMSNGDLNLYYRYSRDGLTWFGSDTVTVPRVNGTAGYYRATLMKSPTRPGAFDVYAPAPIGFGASGVQRVVLMRGIQLGAQADLLARGHDSVFIPGSQFTAHVGSPEVANMNGLPVMMLDSAVTERVHAVVGLPPSWRSVFIEAIWANAGAGAGNVVLQHNNDFLRPTTVLGSVGYAGANITATAGAQNVVVVTNLTHPGSTPVSNGAAVIRILRRGAEAADTLPNDIGLIGVRLRRAS